MADTSTIHSIFVVKNESDIVQQSLVAASRWSDFIYVFDTGSTDDTWTQVLELARELPQIVPFGQQDREFFEWIRREPFEHYRDRSSAGDWWCKLDADEFYIDSPREFLASVPERFDTVWGAYFQYYLTDQDVASYGSAPERYGDDVPVTEKCRYYICNWSEIKFFRYSARLRWDSGPIPYPLRRSFPRRIRFKHYQYRSPKQIEKRLVARRAATGGMFDHEASAHDWSPAGIAPRDEERSGDQPLFGEGQPASWRHRIVDSSRLVFDTGTDYVITDELLPPIIDPHPYLVGKVRNRLRRARATIGALVGGPRG